MLTRNDQKNRRIELENHDGKEVYITTQQKVKPEEVKSRKRKSKEIITKYPNERHH